MITLMDGSQHLVYSDKNLSGKNQKESGLQSRNMERYEQNELNSMVMKCKTLMTEIMFIVMDLQADIRINRMLYEFKDKIASYKQSNKPKRDKSLRRKASSANKIGSTKSLSKYGVSD